MYYTNFDKLFNSLFDDNNTATWKNYSTTFVPSKFAVDIIDDKAEIALSVLGHDPKNIEINCYEDKIEVKAKKGEEESVYNQLVGNINETISLGKDLDGRNSKAEIKNGILSITVERKEESKPKKLTLKVS
jgi:HSP20 family protein